MNETMGNREFRQMLRALMAQRVEELFDFKVQLMEQEIAEGWRCFHAHQIWFRENLPPPLISESGRRFSCEGLLEQLSREYGKIGIGYTSTFRKEIMCSGETRAGYRNYLEPGEIHSFLDSGTRHVYDQVAHEAFLKAIEIDHRHPVHEIRRFADLCLLEAEAWASRTRPFNLAWHTIEPPRRDEAVPLASDGPYWRAVHDDGFDIVSVPQNITSRLIRQIMTQIAPDFPYCSRLSAPRRSVFVEDKPGQPAWAIVFEKPGFVVVFPPVLVLLSANRGRKWADGDVVFQDVLADHLGTRTYSGRGDELFLLYALARYRRLIRFYQAFVDAALSTAEDNPAARPERGAESWN